MRRIRLSAGGPGTSRVRVNGRGANLPHFSSIATPLTVQLKSADAADAACWSSQYDHATALTLRSLKAERRIRQPDTRPNILVIQLDDTRADGIDRMPTLAQLASQGVTFTNSFVVTPLCTPSRASLISGLRASHHGVKQLGAGATIFRQRGGDRQTVAVWLQAAGYMTGLFGKYVNGYGYDQPEQTIGAGGTYYVPPGWSRWQAMTSGEHYGGVLGPPYALVDEHGRRTLYDDHATDQQYSTDVLAAELRRFIQAAVDNERPFFAVWTPYASHSDTPYFAPNPAIRHLFFFRSLPPWRPANWEEADISDKPRWLQTYPLAAAGDPIDLYNEGIRQRAYESLLAVDEQLRRILETLVDLQIDQNTIIFLTSDNGASWGEHRIVLQAKDCGYEECLRVPMIVRDPRFPGHGVTYDAPVLNLDVAPTVAALAGVVPPVPTDGMSFAPFVTATPPAAWRGDFLLEHWSSAAADYVYYTGQPSDGDQLRVLYGDPRTTPRASVLFEFDSGNGGTPGAVAVPIGANADETFATLAAAIKTALPFTSPSRNASTNALAVVDNSPNLDGVYSVVERDAGGVMAHYDVLANYVGVRDVANSLTYLEHESGEVELYDLVADPAQLDNKAGDPAYADTQARLAARLDELLDEVRQ